jgi:hypothetical protein
MVIFWVVNLTYSVLKFGTQPAMNINKRSGRSPNKKNLRVNGALG